MNTINRTILTLAILSGLYQGTFAEQMPDESPLKDTQALGEPSKATGPFAPSKRALRAASEETPAQEYLTAYLYPFTEEESKQEVKINFKDAALSELNTFIERTFNVTFIPDDAITPEPPTSFGTPPGAKPMPMNAIKLSFYTHKPLTKRRAWDLYTMFLDMAGLTLVPGPGERIYRITAITGPTAKGALPTFIGIDPEQLPDNDMRIRYLYFTENGNTDTIATIANTLRSGSGSIAQSFSDLGAVLLTEKATNLKALMRIIKEIDRTTLPEAIGVIKLKKADATAVAGLIKQLIGEGDQQQPPSVFGPQQRPRKAQTKTYFSPNMRILEEPRTNSLIIFGTQRDIKRVEDFVKEQIDTDVELPYSPLHIRKLKYGYAPTIADILNKVTKFNPTAEAAKYGGVRDGDKYFRPITIVAEQATNSVIISSADYEDLLKILEVLDRLDVEQPQAWIQVLVLDIDLATIKELGSQIRNKFNVNGGSSTRDILGAGTNFQNSGLNGSGIISNPPMTGDGQTSATQENALGATRLLGNLINLVTGEEPGTALFTLGQDAFGVWGILKILQSQTKVSVISNPYFLVTHKTTAVISVGQTRRIPNSIVQGVSTTTSSSDLNAGLTVQIMPLISGAGLSTLQILVDSSEFTDPANPTNGNRTQKTITTQAIVSSSKENYDVLAIGGIVRNRVLESFTKLSILGDIPILGWLFKNKRKTDEQSSLLILISAQQIEPHEDVKLQKLSSKKIREAKNLICSYNTPSDARDPVHRWFFKDSACPVNSYIDDFTARKYDEGVIREEQLAQSVLEEDRSSDGQAPALPAPQPPQSGAPVSGSALYADQQKQVAPEENKQAPRMPFLQKPKKPLTAYMQGAAAA